MIRNIWALVLALLATCAPAPCGTYFSRVTGQTWATNSTWSTAACNGAAAAAYPVAGDTVTVCTGHTVTADADFAWGNGNATDLTIQAGAILIDDGHSMSQGGGISLIGTLTFNPGSTWSPTGAYATTYQGTTTPAALNLNGTTDSRVTVTGDATRYTWLAGSTGNQVINLYASYANIWLGGGAHYAILTEGNGNTQHIEFTDCLLRFQTRTQFTSVYYPSVSSTVKFINSDLRLGVANWLVVGKNDATNFNFNANNYGMWNTTIEGIGSGTGSTITIQAGTGATSQFVMSNVVMENVSFVHKSPVAMNYVAGYAHLNPNPGPFQSQASSGTSTIQNSVAWGDGTNTHFFSVAGSSGQTVNYSNNFSEGADPTGAENHYAPDEVSGANATVTLSHNITLGGNAVISRNASSGNVTIDHHTHVGKSNTDCDALWISETTQPMLTAAVLKNSLLYSTCTNAAMRQLANGTIGSGLPLTYTDYNAYYNVAAGSRYVSTTVAGKVLGDIGFGSADIVADAQFVNGAATVATWDTSLGGAGTAVSAFGNLMCLNGYDRSGNACTPSASYSVAGFLSYIQAAYAPKNTALKGAANDGGDIGAIPVLGTARRASVTWR